MKDLVKGTDGLARCWWCVTDPDYVAYHDTEWGRPVHDDQRLYEKLCLEGFQAGLSWLTILRKRPAFRAAFSSFDIDLVAGYSDADADRLMTDSGIVRNRAKIEASIANARAVQRLRADGESLDGLVWSFAPTEHRRPTTSAEILPASPESTALSKALRTRGFRFVGPTTVYAFMQAMGLVNDHLVGCHAADGDRATQQ